MAEAVDESDFLYETNENGVNVLVRALESVQQVFLRFVNNTSRPVDIWWRDFEGHRRHYYRMEADAEFCNIDTYVTHPWEFSDPSTKEPYAINNQRVFRAPASLAGMRHRTNWIISICVRPLRAAVLLSLAQRVQDQSKVPELGLPRELSSDLTRLMDAIQNPPPPPPPQRP